LLTAYLENISRDPSAWAVSFLTHYFMSSELIQKKYLALGIHLINATIIAANLSRIQPDAIGAWVASLKTCSNLSFRHHVEVHGYVPKPGKKKQQRSGTAQEQDPSPYESFPPVRMNSDTNSTSSRG
jgi:hypothetical protein